MLSNINIYTEGLDLPREARAWLSQSRHHRSVKTHLVISQWSAPLPRRYISAITDQSCFHCGLLCSQEIRSSYSLWSFYMRDSRPITPPSLSKDTEFLSFPTMIKGICLTFYNSIDDFSQNWASTKYDRRSPLEFLCSVKPCLPGDSVVVSSKHMHRWFVCAEGLPCRSCVWGLPPSLQKLEVNRTRVGIFPYTPENPTVVAVNCNSN